MLLVVGSLLLVVGNRDRLESGSKKRLGEGSKVKFRRVAK